MPKIKTVHGIENRKVVSQKRESKGIFMRLVRLRAPGGLENLKLVEEFYTQEGAGLRQPARSPFQRARTKSASIL